MAKIAFILLCHKDPEGIIRQALSLVEAGDSVAIHFDARASRSDYDLLRAALGQHPRITFAPRRHRCGWGEWSLVAASLTTIRAARAAFPEATHFYMISGDCMPIKTAEYAHAMLDGAAVDYIESFDFHTSEWIQTGLREDRLIYRHLFNERANRWLFYASYGLQRRLGLTRRIPSDLAVMIGSQWWCLRRATIDRILEFTDQRPDILRFFRTTWIPDETFFQTLVRHLVADAEICCRTPTFLMFTDYGMPVTFYNDHYDLLLAQDHLFARKISPQARDLKDRLSDLWGQRGLGFHISDEGRRLYRFLTGRGRVGRRFAPRYWERAASIGRDRTLYLILCKKWHLAKRLSARIAAQGAMPGLEYVFHEAGAALPDLGGIQTTLEKRTRHRRALMRMLFDWHQCDRLVICLDPSGLDLIQDFAADSCALRILEMDCDFSDDYLAGHARRVGLASDQTPPEVLARLLPTIRYDLAYESDRLRAAGLADHHRLRQAMPPEAAAQVLAHFLDLSDLAQARALADDLFDD